MKTGYLVALVVVLGIIGFFVWRHMKQKKEGLQAGQVPTAPPTPGRLKSEQGAPPPAKKGGRRSFFGKIRHGATSAVKRAAHTAAGAGAGFVSAYTGGIIKPDVIQGVVGI